MKEDIAMSHKEADRVAVLEQLRQKRIKQAEAATMLGLSTRQVRRVAKQYFEKGVTGLSHQSRGRVSNRKIPQEAVDRAVSIVAQHYADFGPTFAHEKLVAHHGISFGVDVLRQAMIIKGVWTAKKRRRPRIHQMRERRAHEGELVQLDGSPHNWFEGRGGLPPCTLLNAVDDATSKIEHAKFVPSESLSAYFGFATEYFRLNGKPRTWYVDKHSVFRVNRSNGGQAAVTDSHALTQFSRAMQQLGVTLIFANTPQAKGRVERSNQTLQDRLVKEMRLRGINTPKEANEYLPTFIAQYNHKFAVTPREQTNLHLPLTLQDKLDHILVRREQRILSKNLTCQYHELTYQIQTDRPSYALRYAVIMVYEDQTGRVKLYYKGKELTYTIIKRQTKSQIVDSKELNHQLNQQARNQKPKQQNLWDSVTAEAWEQHFLA